MVQDAGGRLAHTMAQGIPTATVLLQKRLSGNNQSWNSLSFSGSELWSSPNCVEEQTVWRGFSKHPLECDHMMIEHAHRGPQSPVSE